MTPTSNLVGVVVLLLNSCSLLECTSCIPLGIPNRNSNEYGNFIDMCRQEFRTTGVLHIPDFLNPIHVEQLLKEAKGLLRQRSTNSFTSSDAHTIYQEEVDPTFAPHHVRNALQQSSKTIVDYDRLEKETSPLRLIYNSNEFKDFIQDVISCNGDDGSANQLYRSACPYNAAYYNLYEKYDSLGWHFDKGEFGVNLVLQAAEHGGEFELHFRTRSISDLWAFEAVKSILKNDDSALSPALKINSGPGSLILFAGKYNLHRVTPVVSNVPRINAIVHFERTAGVKLSAYSLQKFFGR